MTKKRNSPKKIRYPKRWYVMFHLEPTEIERQLQQVNEVRKGKQLRLLEYFIPYQFLPKAEADEYAKDAAVQKELAEASNDLRKAIRTYVFIKATMREINALVNQSWNRQSRLKLFFRRSYEGRQIIMPDKKMQQFITTCCESRQRFTFGPPIEDIESYDTVIIKEGVFKDSEAKVLDVQHTTTGISLTLGIPFFCGEKTLELKDFKASDLHLPRTVESLLNDNFIANVEKSVLSVLAHRIKPSKPESGNDPDEAVLNRISHYGYVQMNDSPSHIHFRCMMLICAALRIDEDSRKAMTNELLCLLTPDTHRLTPSDTALVHASLYVSTSQVEYRASAKAYWQSHREESSPLSRLMPLITRINRKFFKHLKIANEPHH